MITFFLAVIFYIVDPVLGVILAISLPAVLALDMTGEYSHAVVAVMFSVTVYFVRKVAFDQRED